MKTLILIIMDESQSMLRTKSDVIRGFNEFIDSQKEITADMASCIFVKFNTIVTVVHDVKPIDETTELTALTFQPAGWTALYDAIWDGVRLGEKKEAEFDRVLCLIMTDGEENASRKISSTGIRNLLKNKEDGGKWTFLYIGENPERWARQTGISQGNVVQYNHSAPRDNFQSSIQAVSMFRNETQCQQPQLFQRIQPQTPIPPSAAPSQQLFQRIQPQTPPSAAPPQQLFQKIQPQTPIPPSAAPPQQLFPPSAAPPQQLFPPSAAPPQQLFPPSAAPPQQLFPPSAAPPQQLFPPSAAPPQQLFPPSAAPPQQLFPPSAAPPQQLFPPSAAPPQQVFQTIQPHTSIPPSAAAPSAAPRPPNSVPNAIIPPIYHIFPSPPPPYSP